MTSGKNSANELVALIMTKVNGQFIRLESRLQIAVTQYEFWPGGLKTSFGQLGLHVEVA